MNLIVELINFIARKNDYDWDKTHLIPEWRILKPTEKFIENLLRTISESSIGEEEIFDEIWIHRGIPFLYQSLNHKKFAWM